MTSPLVAVREIRIPFGRDLFRVELGVPRNAPGVVFLLRDNGNVVHGAALAAALRKNGFGTAVCQLLTDSERERAAAHRRTPICASLLADRLMAVVDCVGDEPELGAGVTGIATSGIAAAAALRVAAFRPLAFDAIACRHANILSMRSLPYVRAATLFLAVAGDLARIRPMTRAFQQLQCTKRFEIVSGDSPGFEDDRSFHHACELTAGWMRKYLARAATAVLHGHHSTSVSSAITAIPAEINVV
jgi:putative phosphoribosyl transferase